jgi:serine protease Do
MNSGILGIGTVAILFVFSLGAAAQESKEKKKAPQKQGWLGVSIQDVTPKLARDKGLKVKEGAYINEVVEESPAEEAGIKTGDVVIEFNGKKVEIADDLTDHVRATAPDSKVNIKVSRNSETKSIAVSIGKNTSSLARALSLPRSPRILVNMFGGIEGMELLDLNKQLAEYFEAPNNRGVLVKDVKRKSNAEKAGFKAGDVVVKVGKETVFDTEEIRDALSDLSAGDSVEFEVIRKGRKSTIQLEISEKAMGENFFRYRNGEADFNFHIAPQMEKIEKELQRHHFDLQQLNKDKERIRILKRVDEV